MNAHIELINTRHHNIDRLSSCFALNVDSQIMHVPHKYSVCVCARARFFFFYLWFSSSAFIIHLSLSPSLFFNRQHSCIRALSDSIVDQECVYWLLLLIAPVTLKQMICRRVTHQDSYCLKLISQQMMERVNIFIYILTAGADVLVEMINTHTHKSTTTTATSKKSNSRLSGE